jgi:hypothetical protein
VAWLQSGCNQLLLASFSVPLLCISYCPPHRALSTFTFLIAGSTNLLAPAAAGAGAQPALPYGPARRGAGGKIRGNLAGGTSVLVGALQGSLYALPADHLVLDARGLPPRPLPLPDASANKCTDCDPAAWGRGLGGLSEDECPAEDLGIEEDAGDYGSAAGGGGGLVPLTPGTADELAGLTCPQPALGLYQLTQSFEGAAPLAWLPAARQRDGEVRMVLRHAWSSCNTARGAKSLLQTELASAPNQLYPCLLCCFLLTA